MRNRYLIGLGSSHSRAEHYMDAATMEISQIPSVCILSQSDTERSGGVGTQDPLAFLNKVVLVETSLAATALWFELRAIETKLGRIRMMVNGPRTIDLDVLYGLGIKNDDAFVTMPHPRFFVRKFACDLGMQALRRAGEDDLPILLSFRA